MIAPMKITKVETVLVRIPMLDRFGGQKSGPEALAGGLYHFEKEWNEVHPLVSQCVLVCVETDAGLHGWGECQAPIAPEATREIIDQLLGPMILGADPHAVNSIWERMYRSMAGRGQITGFMLDAMAGIDIALWDIKAKLAGLRVALWTVDDPVWIERARATGVEALITNDPAAMLAHR